jgi:hypothetical protein
MDDENLDTNSNLIERDEKGRLKKGVILNPNGRPKGSLSVIGYLKQMWEEDPEDFKKFVREYREDPSSRKHITEMIDNKPMQKTDITSDGKPLTVIVPEAVAKSFNINATHEETGTDNTQ